MGMRIHKVFKQHLMSLMFHLEIMYFNICMSCSAQTVLLDVSMDQTRLFKYFTDEFACIQVQRVFLI